MITPNDFTRIDNDSNGNPRYVAHFLHFLTAKESGNNDGKDFVARKYNQALARARKFGGRKFHNKQYGGGIAFCTYGLNSLCKQINRKIEFDQKFGNLVLGKRQAEMLEFAYRNSNEWHTFASDSRKVALSLQEKGLLLINEFDQFMYKD